MNLSRLIPTLKFIRSPTVSLNGVLVTSFIVQIFAIAGLVGWLSIRNDRQAIEDLARRVHSETSLQVTQHLNDYLGRVHLIDQTNRDALQIGVLDPSNLEAMQRLFFKEIQTFKVSYINFVTPSGDYAGAGYEADRTLATSEINKATLKKLHIYNVDQAAKRTKLKNVQPYDPYSERWYIDAVKAGHPVWSQIYQWDGVPEVISISSGYPLYDTKERLIGVLGVDLVLSDISQSLRNLPVSRSGVVFIVERSGLLVASSSSEPVTTIVHKKADRLSAFNSGDAQIRAAIQHLKQTFSSLEQIHNKQLLEVSIVKQGSPVGTNHYVQVTPWQDEKGLDWLVVSVAPESEFTGQVDAQDRIRLLLCVIAVTGATTIATLIARWLTTPILRFSQASNAIAFGELNQVVKFNLGIPIRIRELDRLAASFNQMSQQLQASFQTLETANETLEIRVEDRTAELRLRSNITSQIRKSLDLDTILQTAVIEIRSLMQIDRCTFVWYNPHTTPATWEAVTESKLPTVESALGLYSEKFAGVLGKRFLNVQTIQLDEVSQLTEPVLRRLLIAFGCTSLLGLPMQKDGKVVGVVICTQTKKIRPWKPEEVELLRGVVDQLAIAMSQAELYAEARNNAEIAQAQALRLAAAMKELQQTQAQLIQTEKMASLGQMVAGIAHEINNPVSFIYGNISHAEEYAQSMVRLLHLYQQQYPTPSVEIEAEMDQIDLRFLIEDLPRLFRSMHDGADRIQKIVQSLRTFSRLDESDFKAVNLHQGIDSTLMILESRLRALSTRPAIQVIKHYGSLPLIKCYAGELNQVFLNILSNAIDALDTYSQPQSSPSITIKTQGLDGSQVAITITDNGMGMDENVRSKLFDPFFTTKPIGKGAGLGLAVSYQIVTERHRGQLECISKLGAGAQFVITIPILQGQHYATG